MHSFMSLNFLGSMVLRGIDRVVAVLLVEAPGGARPRAAIGLLGAEAGRQMLLERGDGVVLRGHRGASTSTGANNRIL